MPSEQIDSFFSLLYFTSRADIQFQIYSIQKEIQMRSAMMQSISFALPMILISFNLNRPPDYSVSFARLSGQSSSLKRMLFDRSLFSLWSYLWMKFILGNADAWQENRHFIDLIETMTFSLAVCWERNEQQQHRLVLVLWSRQERKWTSDALVSGDNHLLRSALNVNLSAAVHQQTWTNTMNTQRVFITNPKRLFRGRYSSFFTRKQTNRQTGAWWATQLSDEWSTAQRERWIYDWIDWLNNF